MDPMPEWASTIVLAIAAFAVVWILKTIRSALVDLRSELRVTNNSLSRLDRRVAFLEGRLFPGVRIPTIDGDPDP